MQYLSDVCSYRKQWMITVALGKAEIRTLLSLYRVPQGKIPCIRIGQRVVIPKIILDRLLEESGP